MASVYPTPEVVVIDDDQATLDAICDLLVDASITAEGCPSGVYAYKYILHRRPRLVILDVMMPGVDGVEVFHQLRADPFMEHTTVIFFTGDTYFLAHRFPNYQAYGAMLLPKPLDADALIDMVSRALGRTPPLQERSFGGN